MGNAVESMAARMTATFDEMGYCVDPLGWARAWRDLRGATGLPVFALCKLYGVPERTARHRGQKLKEWEAAVKVTARIPYGAEKWTTHESPAKCRDCGVERGALHREYCCIEQDARTGRQQIGME